VNSDPGSPGYGDLRILQLPQNGTILGPAQANNEFQSDPAASIELTQLRKGGSQVTFGNLITLPLDGGLLYAQPVYVSADASGSAGSYPAVKRVFTLFSSQNSQVGYAPTLAASLAEVLGAAAPGQAAPGQLPPGQQTTLQKELQQAQALYAQALAALQASPPDYATYGADLARMDAALNQAAKLAGQPAASPSPSPSATPG
jgi:uncharacterized membrane protein (UPF0182 family)